MSIELGTVTLGVAETQLDLSPTHLEHVIRSDALTTHEIDGLTVLAATDVFQYHRRKREAEARVRTPVGEVDEWASFDDLFGFGHNE